MTSMHHDPRRRRVVIGVDTHKYVHVAVALDTVGGRLDARSFPANRAGYEQLTAWAKSLGGHLAFAIEDRLVWGRADLGGAPAWRRGR